MKKILIICIVVLVLGGGAFFLFHKNSDEKSNEGETNTVASNADEWNPYSKEIHHSFTLSDQLLSAGGGKHIIKMSITLDFANADSYYRFLGYEDKKTAEKELSSEEESSTDSVTPMELKINDTIGQLMMAANDTQLVDRDMLKTYLKNGINSALAFENDVVSDVFIENYVMQ